MYEYFRELVHRYSPDTSISATLGGGENWEREISLLVAHEEKEDPIRVYDEFMKAPFPSQQKHKHPLSLFEASFI